MFKYIFNSTVKPRISITNYRTKISFKRQNMPYHCYLKFNDYQEMLMKNLCMGNVAAKKVLLHQPSIFDIPEDHLIAQCQLCRKWSIDSKTLFKDAALLNWSGQTLENRASFLRELGVMYLHAAMVSQFSNMMGMKMHLFKAYTNIPKRENVADNLLNYLDPPPKGIQPLKMLNENRTVDAYHKRCLAWYVEWKLNVSKDNEPEMRRVVRSMKRRSFDFTRRLFDILHCEVGLTIDEIKKHNCLGSGSPDDIRRIIDEIETLAGVNVKRLIKSVPILHRMEYNNVVHVKKLLNDYDYSNKSIRRCPEIFLISKDEIAMRLESMHKTPELRVLSNNDKSLKLIWLFNDVQIRLRYLRYLRIRITTVRALTGRTTNFNRFVRTGRDHTKGREIGYSFAKIFNLEPKEIERRIRKHRNWRFINLVSMHESLDFLLQTYLPEDIEDNLQLILYPREKIEETLESLPEINEETSTETKQYSPKYILAVCLYEIEREHHFNGDGIWSYDTLPSRPASSKKSENDLSDFSDSEYPEPDENEDLSNVEQSSVNDLNKVANT